MLEVGCSGSVSYFWRSFLWGRELLKMGLRRRIGDGADTLFYKDPWLPIETTFKPSLGPRPPASLLSSVVSDFISCSHSLDHEKLAPLLTAEELQVVLGIPLGRSGSRDGWLWHYGKDGVYSVKSGYKLVMLQARPASSSYPITLTKSWAGLWALKIPVKIRIFMWRAFQDCLPTMTNLIQRGIDAMLLCKVCRKVLETTDHVLVTCKWARACWELLLSRIDWRAQFNNSFRDRCILLQQSLSEEEFGLWCVGCWALWNDRNSVREGSFCPDVNVKCKWIVDYIDSYVAAQQVRADSTLVGR